MPIKVEPLKKVDDTSSYPHKKESAFKQVKLVYPDIDLTRYYNRHKYKAGGRLFEYYKSKKDDGTFNTLYIVFSTQTGPDSDADRYLTDRCGNLLKLFLKECRLGYNIAIGCITDDYDDFKRPYEAILKKGQTLLDDIYDKKPKTILAFGEKCRTFLHPKETGTILHIRGKLLPLEVQDHKCNVIYTYHLNRFITSSNPKKLKDVSNSCLALRMDVSKAALHATYDLESYSKAPKYKAIDTVDKLKKVLSSFDKIYENNPEDFVAFDTESTSLSYVTNTLLAVSFSASHTSGYTVLVDHKDATWTPEENKEIKEILGRWFSESKVRKAAQNSKFDMNLIRCTLGVHVNNVYYDTMFLQYLLDPTYSLDKKKLGDFLISTGINNLEGMAHYWLDFGDESWLQTKKDRAVLEHVDGDKVIKYATEDAVLTYRVAKLLLPLIAAKSKKMVTHTIPILASHNVVVAEMEYNGMPFNIELADELLDTVGDKSIRKLLKDVEDELYRDPIVKKANKLLEKNNRQPSLFEDVGTWYFKIGSHDHQVILFKDVMKLPAIELSNKEKEKNPDKYATDKRFVREYGDNPIVSKFSEYKKSEKIIGTLSGFRDKVQEDKHVRTSFSIIGTDTGRLASYAPSFHTMPRVSEDNKFKELVKRTFFVEDDWIIVAVDYSANEVRAGGLATADEALASSFWKIRKLRDGFRKNPSKELAARLSTEGDPHRQNYALAYNIPVSEVTKEQRQHAKAITFKVMYAWRPEFSLATDLGITVEEAKEKCDRFLGRFKKLRAGLYAYDEMGKSLGYTENPLGRRRNVYNIFVDEKYCFNHAVNQSRNTPIQGFGTDMTMLAAKSIIDYIRKNNKEWLLSNFVHDALYFRIKKYDLKEFLEVSEPILVRPPLDNYDIDPDFMPMEVEYEIGKNMADCTHWDFTQEHLSLIQEWVDNGCIGNGPSSPFIK